MRNSQPRLLFGLSAAARLVGVSESTLRRYGASGIINPQRDSAGRRIITRSDIERAREYRARGEKVAAVE